MDNQDLLSRIEAFHIGSSDASLNFTQRLARENSWSDAFAHKVIVEYKRFIYLACLSENDITPSDEVDQAWHLHLTYTASYWGGLCKDTLGFELHHSPTKGGSGERNKFKVQYLYTLSLYKKVFKQTPPEDIWPPAKERFKSAEKFTRTNLDKQWVIRKPSLQFKKLLTILVLPLFLVACTESFADKDVWFWLKVAFGIYIIYKIINWLGGGANSGGNGGCGASGGDSGCGGGCGG